MFARVLIPSVLICFATAGSVQAQDATDELAALMRASSSSPNPVVAFLTGFEQMDDFRLDGDGISRALTKAGIPPEGAMSEFLASTTGIEKKGATIKLRRSRPLKVPMGQGAIKLDKKVELRLSQGSIKDLGRKDRGRLAPATGTYVRFSNIDGIEVGESVDSLYTLYDFLYVQEGRQPVVHIKAGTWFYKKWKKITLPAPEERITDSPDRGGLVANVENIDRTLTGDEETLSNPDTVLTPDPESKARIDEAVEEVEPELDAMGQDLRSLLEAYRRDQQEGMRRIEARIAELNAQTKRLEQEIAELRQMQEGRRYDDRDRVDGPRDLGRPIDRSDDPRADRREPEKKKKPGIFTRLFRKAMEGVKRGLQRRYANAANDNLEARLEVLSNGTTAANQPYLDSRYHTAITRSDLGHTLGVQPNTNGVIRVRPYAPVRSGPSPLGVNRTKINLPLGFEVIPRGGRPLK